MSRVQVRRMIRVEAVIIAVLGAVLGIVIGLVFGWVMQRSLSDVGIDRFAVPYGQLVVFIVASAILGVGAAVFPARRAARLDVLAAIAYE
jgi:putative ABC transport system permease protein